MCENWYDGCFCLFYQKTYIHTDRSYRITMSIGHSYQSISIFIHSFIALTHTHTHWPLWPLSPFSFIIVVDGRFRLYIKFHFILWIEIFSISFFHNYYKQTNEQVCNDDNKIKTCPDIQKLRIKTLPCSCINSKSWWRWHPNWHNKIHQSVIHTIIK